MIKLVTDSVASIPADLLEGKSIEVVTLYVNRDGVEYADATMDLDAFYADIYEMIDNIPTSSQPSQQHLEDMFTKIAQAGDQLLGIFMSSKMSGSYEGALRAARAVKERIPSFDFAIVDSQSNSFDEAWPILGALEAAQSGESLKACVEKVLRSIESTRFLFTPESLTFLQKGGRIGGAAALIGNLLQLAPVLTVIDGEATPVAKVRSRKKACERIVQEFLTDVETYGLKNIVVHYIGDKTPAVEWANSVIEPLLGRSVRVIPVSPVIGLHVGPAVGIAYECENPMPHKFPQGVPGLVSFS